MMDSITEGSIFVLIPSYRDPELLHTVLCLFENASRPHLVFVGIYEQEDPSVAPLAIPQLWAAQVRITRVPWTLAKGPCFARSEAAKLYGGERFVLFLDSHMRMVKHWDDVLVNQWRMCGSDKAIITTYPLGYEIPEGGTRHWSDAKVRKLSVVVVVVVVMVVIVWFDWFG